MSSLTHCRVETDARGGPASAGRLPIWHIRITDGLVGTLRCAGPTLLTRIGIFSATTLFVSVNVLYDSYGWFLGGLVVLTLPMWVA